MPTYSITYGADVRAYASGRVQAETLESAVATAKERFDELWANGDIDHVDYAYPRHPTLIDVTDDETGDYEEPCDDFSVTETDRIEDAASDLLAALRDLLACDELNVEPESLSRATAEAIEQAVAAIAKATGGAA